MFSKACGLIRKSTYGVLGSSVISQNGPKKSINVTNATAFMVAPGYIVTAAHFIHQENNPTKPVHQIFEAIRAPEVGQGVEQVSFVAEDSARDIALLKIEKPRHSSVVKLKDEVIDRGTNCGFLGFPLATVEFMQSGKKFNLFERFQGAYISNYMENQDVSGRSLPVYEIDTLMYPGSSGCPCFNLVGEVIGMQVASRVQKNKVDNKEERVAISVVVPSVDIVVFLTAQKLSLPK
jgi:S1-C subfamily serine protease